MGDGAISKSGGRVMFFGGYEQDYPRTAVIRKGLQKLGFSIDECRVGTDLKVYFRYPALFYAYLRKAAGCRVVFVPSFRHKDIPLAWFLTRLGGKKLVFDPLVSRYETRVIDRGDFASSSSQAWHNRNIDRLSLRLPDLVISDTEAHSKFYKDNYGLKDDSLAVVPVGFDEDLFERAEDRTVEDKCEILFFGSFLPLHGVETIARAALLLSGKRVRFTLIGKGQTYEQVKRITKDLPEGMLRFIEGVPIEELQSYIESSHIVLGIFGTTLKSDMVVPNKVFQAMAVGRAVVTADTTAVREIFQHAEHLFTVPPGDHEELARAIELLCKNEELRKKLADWGARLVRKEYNSMKIASRLIASLEERGLLEGSYSQF